MAERKKMQRDRGHLTQRKPFHLNWPHICSSQTGSNIYTLILDVPFKIPTREILSYIGVFECSNLEDDFMCMKKTIMVFST